MRGKKGRVEEEEAKTKKGRKKEVKKFKRKNKKI